MVMLMSKSDERQWAKEIIIEAIDVDLYRLSKDELDFGIDEEYALLKQRNRIASFLGFPTKSLNELYKR